MLQSQLLHLVVLCSFILLLSNNFVIHPDNYYLSQLANNFFEGKKYYIDFVEISPLIGLLYYSPPIIISNNLGVPPITALTIYYCLLTITFYILLAKTCKDIELEHYQFIGFIILFTLFIHSPNIIYAKDYISFLLLTPWLLKSVVINYTPRKLELVLALIGLLGKPYFYLVPVLTYFWNRKNKKRSTELKNLTFFVLGGAIYILGCYVYSPEYFLYLSELTNLYSKRNSWDLFISTSLIYTGIFLFIALSLFIIFITKKKSEHVILCNRLAGLAILGFFIVLIQGKFIQYHYAPVILVLITLIAILIQQESISKFVQLLCLSIVLAFGFKRTELAMNYFSPQHTEIIRTIGSLPTEAYGSFVYIGCSTRPPITIDAYSNLKNTFYYYYSWPICQFFSDKKNSNYNIYKEAIISEMNNKKIKYLVSSSYTSTKDNQIIDKLTSDLTQQFNMQLIIQNELLSIYQINY
ncbi:hypothetical protein QWY77_03045 [Thalassotalea ponticola]|uniref:hypothetical protein n=1 Tax=Thalassotalea ponticola TaxID=1523392 RepID=UPI0025B409D9|nr:hypothetical protein [Thalassotalea ponticola]MDN3651741.1 hypothetical protein [Thalassotalea ponticola]